ncbi:MAG: glycosyltransferase family 4 protein [Planctomycetaceae bacterium]|nr:glycosyltransferase family 4 protein [Planctomycetaceae bacterium]
MDDANESPPSFRIISRSNGVGLDRDVELVRRLLPLEATVERHAVRSLVPFSESFQPHGKSPGWWNILFERIPFSWLCGSGRRVLIPNQERFPTRHLKRLRRVDRVFCKSMHAKAIFENLGVDAEFIGFTSFDRFLPNVQRNYKSFIHVAGRSTLKGTSTLLNLWWANPHWPTLTLVQHPSNAPKVVPENVHLIGEYLNDDRLRHLQNTHGIHLCPSSSEGWGHYIVEGMSCQAVVVTTDAPPMNELVDSSRGMLVGWNRSIARNLGMDFVVDPSLLEAKINAVLAMSEARLEDLGTRARQWYLENDRNFSACGRAALLDLAAA